MSISFGGNRLSVHPGLIQASAAAEKELSASGAVLYRSHVTLEDLMAHIRYRMASRRPELARTPGLGGWRWMTARACMTEAEKLGLNLSPELARSFQKSFSDFFRVVDLLPELNEDIWPSGFKGRWLKSVYADLREEMRRRGMFSDGDVIKDFLALPVSSIDLPLLESFEGIELCGFSNIYPLHLRMLLHLSSLMPLLFRIDYDPSKDEGASHPAFGLLRAIEIEARDLNVEIEFASRSRNVFSSADNDAYDWLRLIECESRRDETDWCSRQILDLLNSGVKPSSIVVVCSEIEAYRPHLRRQIREHLMPYAYRRSAGILSAPALRWLAFLPKVLENTIRTDVVAALTDNLCSRVPSLWPLDSQENSHCVELLRRAGILELSGRLWLASFVQGEERESLQKFAGALESLRNEFGKSRTIEDHIDFFSQILSNVRFYAPDATDDHRHFSLDWHAAQIAKNVLEEWRFVAQSELDLIPASVFIRDLSEELDRNLRLRSSPEPDAVAVVSPEEVSGLDIGHLFWLGLVEGVFPTPFSAGILSDSEAGHLNRKNGSEIWPDSRNAWRKSRALFRTALENAENVTLSYFRKTEDGEEKQPSSFYIELRERKSSVSHEKAVMKIEKTSIPASRTELLRIASQSGDIESLSCLYGRDEIERVSQKLQIERERHDFFVFGSYDDACRAGEYNGLVQDFSLNDSRPLNAGFFETYAQCPFLFFMRRVIGLREDPEEAFELEAREVGTLLHDIMKELAESGDGDWNRVSEMLNADDFTSRLESDFRRLVSDGDKWRVTLAVLRSREWAERLLTYINNLENAGAVKTVMTEASFGSGQRSDDGLVEELEIHGPEGSRFTLSGRIDRVDWDGEVLHAVDYKSGSPSNKYTNMLKADYWGEECFQMPIYLIALKRSVAAGKMPMTPKAYMAQVAILKEPEKKHRSSASMESDAPLFEDNEFVGKMEQIVRRVSSGDFRITPRNCRACPYPSVCRVVKQFGKNE